MATSQEKLAALKAQFNTLDNTGGNQKFQNNYYPFWNMTAGQRTVVRFLPDLNEDNPRGFLVEKVFHNLVINGQKKTVPCLSMFGEDCPICKISQDYYKAKDEVNGGKYWRKKQYIAQALVVEDPLPADQDSGETNQGKVRYLAIGWQIYNIIKEAFASEDEPLDSLPHDFKEGYDFIIKKTEGQGKHDTYTMGTKFYSKQRALTEDELAVVSEHMIDLSTLLPKHPGLEKVQAMLNANLNGENYSDGKDETGAGSSASETNIPFDTTTTKATPAAVVTKSAPVTETAGDSDVDDMLAAIRNRRQQKTA